MTNGRQEYIKRSLSTLHKLHGNFSRILIHDDSGNSDYRNWLKQYGYEIAYTERVGFAKAMISAWDKLREDKNEWIFHLEEDFIFLEDIYIDAIIDVMNHNKHIVEMVLLRQPIGHRERMKGGIIASHPERYEDKTDNTNYWVEHRVNFSCNPCLYRKSLISKYEWPDTPYSEREYGKKLFSEPEVRCAYWGKSTDQPRVYHIGNIRSGFNY